MALYLISYDINEKDQFEYEPLWGKLKEIGAARILYSEWIITGNDSARSIYDKLAPLTQLKDRLLVQEITKDAVWDKLLIQDDTFRKWLAYARG
jgi:hypothetical protein